MIGFYPITYFILDRTFGLLSTKSPLLLSNTAWNIAFYTHIIFGGVALLIGWSNFSRRVRSKYLILHKRLGRVYVFAALCSALAGLYIACYATGGPVAITGFGVLGFLWLFSTWRAYASVKQHDLMAHKQMMVYSYAVCFSAVTLRLWLPLLVWLLGDFTSAYQLVAWLCWVPNVLVAYILNKSPQV